MELQNDDVHNFHYIYDTVRVINYRKARTVEMRNMNVLKV